MMVCQYKVPGGPLKYSLNILWLMFCSFEISNADNMLFVVVVNRIFNETVFSKILRNICASINKMLTLKKDKKRNSTESFVNILTPTILPDNEIFLPATLRSIGMPSHTPAVLKNVSCTTAVSLLINLK
jgi:hypothetical protein